MKKIVIAILVVGLLITGLWCTIRRRPGALPPAEDNQTVFRTEVAENGTLVRYEDPQTPLRSLKWLPPVQNGILVAQVVSQNDRQQISLFRDGAFLESYLVPKPEGVREGFFRIAELKDARILEGNVAVLFYMAPGSAELPLLVALDLETKNIRWIHRALGERLAMAEGKEGAIYLFGPKTPPVRLPLALVSGEKTSPTGARSVARTIEFPPEVLEVSDLIPTGAWTFLLAHKGGLSAYLGSKGWTHQPVPEGDPGLFPGIGSALGNDAKRYWWQPFPGRVIQVLANGTPKATWTPEELPTAEPFVKDASLLRLMGVDGEGKLWFDLAVPSEPPPPVQAPGTEWKPETPGETSAPTVLKMEDWPAYVGQGLDRLYCWDPQKKLLQRLKWTNLAVPKGFPKPRNGQGFQPASGTMMLENGTTAWLAQLSALAFGEPSKTGQPK